MIDGYSWHPVSPQLNESEIVPLEYFQASIEADEELLKNFEECQYTLDPKIAEELAVIPVPCSVK
jgi:hypothetical protein